MLQDPAAFGELYHRCRSEVLAFFRCRTRCRHTAAELTDETFACAWASRERFDPERGTAIAWILGIARNHHRSWLRDEVRRRAHVIQPDPGDEAVDRVVTIVDLAPERRALSDALGSLSPNLRAALVHRVVLELPYEEVARRLACSPGAARVRVSRALAQLARTWV